MPLSTGVKRRPQTPTHSPSLHCSNFATITCSETHQLKHDMLFISVFCLSPIKAPRSQAIPHLLHSNTLCQFRKSCHSVLWKSWVIIHKILYIFSIFSEQLSHHFAFTGNLALDVATSAPLFSGCFSHSTYISVWYVSILSSLMFLLHFLTFLCKSSQLWISCRLSFYYHLSCCNHLSIPVILPLII